MVPAVRAERQVELAQTMNRYQQVMFFKNITELFNKKFSDTFECALHLSTDQLCSNVEFEFNQIIQNMARALAPSNDLHKYLDMLYVNCTLDNGGLSIVHSPELKRMETGESSIDIGHRINWKQMTDGGINYMLTYLRQKLSSPL